MNAWEVVDQQDKRDSKTGQPYREFTYRNGQIMRYYYDQNVEHPEGSDITKAPDVRAVPGGQNDDLVKEWQKTEADAKRAPTTVTQRPGQTVLIWDPEKNALVPMPGGGGPPPFKTYQDGEGNTWYYDDSIDPNTGKPINDFRRFGEQKPAPGTEPETKYQQDTLAIQRDTARLQNEREDRIAKAEEYRQRAEIERDRINLLVQQGKLNSDNAAERYKQWFNENVVVPFQTAAEERARTAEVRQGQQQEFEQKKAAADYESTRARTALSAGESAVGHTIEAQKYMAGPKWGEQFASALEGVATGDPSKVKFTAEGLTYKTPDYNAIADQAVARALHLISPWAQQIQQAPVTPAAQTQYSQPVPAPDFSTQPQLPPPIQLPKYTG